MNKAEAKNCWDFWDCDTTYRETCLAYKSEAGDNCWNVVGSFTRHNEACTCPKIGACFQFCWECPWFKKLNPDYEDKGSK